MNVERTEEAKRFDEVRLSRAVESKAGGGEPERLGRM